MTTAAADTMPGNPFSTRHVRPGRLPSFDAAGRPVDLARLLARIAEIGAAAAIVGPHGSGKTTLLGHLADALEAEGRRVSRVRITGGSGAVRLLGVMAQARRGAIICVDSWERLGLPWSLFVRWCAGASHTKLIVTAHRAGVMPTLWECSTTPAMLGAIVSRLGCGDTGPVMISGTDVEQTFHAAAGNIREALFLLYDRFEARARAERTPTG